MPQPVHTFGCQTWEGYNTVFPLLSLQQCVGPTGVSNRQPVGNTVSQELACILEKNSEHIHLFNFIGT